MDVLPADSPISPEDFRSIEVTFCIEVLLVTEVYSGVIGLTSFCRWLSI